MVSMLNHTSVDEKPVLDLVKEGSLKKESLDSIVEKTKKEGGKVLCGGKRPSTFNKGYFYEPTVFDNIKDNFSIIIL